jgi:PIN domain nuclease of toxin-antitoxin system
VGRLEVILLDTHALIWTLSGDRKMGKKCRALVERAWAIGEIATSAISFWETGLLLSRDRLTIDMSLADWRQSFLDAGGIEVALDGHIAMRSLDLTTLPSDPADRFIVATALVCSATLVTADKSILGWRHPLVRFDART